MKAWRFKQLSRDSLETEATVTPPETLYHSLATSGEKVAFTTGKEIWTYQRLATEVERLAHGLIERGLRKGDRVALHMANLPELVIAYLACFRVGVIAAPLNIRFKTAELRALLERLRPALYVGQATLYNRVTSIDSSILPRVDVSSLTAPSTILGRRDGLDCLRKPMASRSESFGMWMQPRCC